MRNQVRKLERQVQGLEEDLVARTEQWADLAERRLDGLQQRHRDLARQVRESRPRLPAFREKDDCSEDEWTNYQNDIAKALVGDSLPGYTRPLDRPTGRPSGRGSSASATGSSASSTTATVSSRSKKSNG